MKLYTHTHMYSDVLYFQTPIITIVLIISDSIMKVPVCTRAEDRFLANASLSRLDKEKQKRT